MEDDDLFQLISLGGEPGASPMAQPGASPDHDVGDIVGCFAHDAALQELVALQEAGAPPPKKYKQRSWELLSHARAQKAIHVAGCKVDSSAKEVAAVQRKLQAVAVEFPAVRHALEVKVLWVLCGMTL